MYVLTTKNVTWFSLKMEYALLFYSGEWNPGIQGG